MRTGNQILNKIKIRIIKNVKKVTVEEEKEEILNKFHYDPLFGGHSGQKKLLAKISSYYYWKNMSKDVINFVKGCKQCKLIKLKKETLNLYTLQLPQQQLLMNW